MKYDVFLSSRAKKQFKRFDAHIRHKIKTELLELEKVLSLRLSFLTLDPCSYLLIAVLKRVIPALKMGV